MATLPPPKNGSRNSPYSLRSGKYWSILVQARDLPPGYLSGVFSDFIIFRVILQIFVEGKFHFLLSHTTMFCGSRYSHFSTKQCFICFLHILRSSLHSWFYQLSFIND